MRKIAAISAGALALALWFWRSMDEPAGSAGPALDRGAQSDVEGARRAEGDLRSAAASESGRSAAQSREQSEPESPSDALADAGEESASEAGRPVEVIWAASGQPAPGALVHWRSAREHAPGRATAPNELLGWYLQFEEPESALIDDASAHRADERGRLRLPSEPGLAMARLEDGWCMQELSGEADAPAVLALEPDSGVLLRIVDHRGAPAAGLSFGFLQRLGRTYEEWTWASVDALGEHRLPHLGRRLRAAAEGVWGSEVSESEFYIAAVLHAPQPAFLELDKHAPPVGELVLRLPATGSVVLEARAPDGSLILGRRLWTDLLEERVDPQQFPGDYVNSSIALHDVQGAGRTRYEHVGLGMRFVAQMGYESGDKIYDLLFDGPTQPDEEIVVAVELPVDHPALALQLVDREGAPVSERLVRALLQRNDGQLPDLLDRGGANSDAHGHVRLEYDDLSSAWSGVPARLSLTTVDRGPVLSTSVELAQLPQGAPLNLGALVMERPPLIVAGRVQDEAENPLPGVRLEIEYEQVVNETLTRWRPFLQSRLRTDPEGRFELRHEARPARVRISASAPGYHKQQLELEGFGVEEAVLTLRGMERVPGRLLLPEGMPTDDLQLRFRKSDARLPEWDPWGAGLGVATRPYPDGSFEVALPGAGEWIASVFVRPDDEPVAVIEDIVVEAGERVVDERLQAIALTHLRPFAVEVVDPEGQRVSDGHLRIRRAGRVHDWNSAWVLFDNGYAVLWTQHDTLDLRAYGERHRMAEQRALAGESTRIALLPWLRADLRLSEGQGVLPPDCTLWVELEDDDPQRNAEPVHELEDEGFDSNGVAAWSFSGPGRWRVRLSLWVDADEWTEHALDLPELWVEVLDVPEVQSLEIELSAEALQAAYALALEG